MILSVVLLLIIMATFWNICLCITIINNVLKIYLQIINSKLVLVKLVLVCNTPCHDLDNSEIGGAGVHHHRQTCQSVMNIRFFVIAISNTISCLCCCRINASNRLFSLWLICDLNKRQNHDEWYFVVHSMIHDIVETWYLLTPGVIQRECGKPCAFALFNWNCVTYKQPHLYWLYL